AGFSISKPDLIAQLERGEEPWLPDYQACKEKEISEVSHTGEDLVSDSEVGNQHQEGPGEVESQRNFLRRADGNCSHCLEEGEDGGNQQRSERLLGNHLWKKVDDSIKYGGRFKDLEETTAQQTDPKEPYECFECGKQFIRRSHLIIHQTVHMGEKPLKCTDCRKSFSNSSDLNNHRRSHVSEKPYQCPECGKGFNRKSALSRHERIHTGERPHKCLVCEKSFTQRSNLVAHQVIHTGERLHKCLECEKSFTYRSTLVAHQAIHTGMRPHKCLDCGKSFTWRLSLIA
uniref:Uncharacterized protein n=1 Tax=Pelusios castaneus TaxID=367368 RepID=A0A8C8S9Z9_9SAUR